MAIMTIDYVTIPQHSVLFHASRYDTHKPYPVKCEDTGKTGVYFCINHPFLEEAKCVEYNQDCVINIFRTVCEMKVSNGKYAFTRGYSGRYSEFDWKVPQYDNISHIDFEIGPLSENLVDHVPPCYEFFLSEKDLEKIEYVGNYRMTEEEVRKKWSKW